jgi:hypothetical protein
VFGLMFGALVKLGLHGAFGAIQAIRYISKGLII